jgi:hypothetical protein
LSIGMISGALANDHYRAARSVPLVRRTAGNGATWSLPNALAKVPSRSDLQTFAASTCQAFSWFGRNRRFAKDFGNHSDNFALSPIKPTVLLCPNRRSPSRSDLKSVK